jgi:hypothetical protein
MTGFVDEAIDGLFLGRSVCCEHVVRPTTDVVGADPGGHERGEQA